MSDAELCDYYCDGDKWPAMWDHTGDAQDQWESAAPWMHDALRVLESIDSDEARALVRRARGD